MNITKNHNIKTKIQLMHPAGKKAVSMEKTKYDALQRILLNHLRSGESTHSEILHAITDDFSRRGTQFEGSVEWHMEWVKLDLEARKQIRRIGDKSAVKYGLVS